MLVGSVKHCFEACPSGDNRYTELWYQKEDNCVKECPSEGYITDKVSYVCRPCSKICKTCSVPYSDNKCLTCHGK